MGCTKELDPIFTIRLFGKGMMGARTLLKTVGKLMSICNLIRCGFFSRGCHERLRHYLIEVLMNLEVGVGRLS